MSDEKNIATKDTGLPVDRLLSVEKAAELLSHSAWTVRKWVTDGKIKSNKIGTRRLIPLSEINRLIAETTVPVAAEDARRWRG